MHLSEPCNSEQADNPIECDETTVLLPKKLKSKPVGFLRALKLPGVITVQKCIFFLDLTYLLWGIIIRHSAPTLGIVGAAGGIAQAE